MNVFKEAYEKSLFENEKQRKVWNEHLARLKTLDLKIFQDKLKTPALIPIGSRILFRGELIHTNEITVSLGAGYFVKCSVKQAEIIRQHRISVAEEKLKLLQKEQEYLENQLSFTHENVWSEPGKEIIEEYDDNAENEWKLRHRENIRKHKKETKSSRESMNIPDSEIWEKLEELELREELANELEELKQEYTKENIKLSEPLIDLENRGVNIVKQDQDNTEKKNLHTVTKKDNENYEYSSFKKKDEIEELNRRLSELINDEKNPSCTEEDLIKRLDKIEEKEMLEDELDRLDSSAEEDSINVVESEKPKQKPKKSITFASDYKEECIEINFSHSDVSPIYNDFSKNTGILNPRDIYAAHPENFQLAPVTPILKKSINSISKADGDLMQATEFTKENVSSVQEIKVRHNNIIGDVMEIKHEDNRVTSRTERPPSKFKIMRMQKQS